MSDFGPLSPYINSIKSYFGNRFNPKNYVANHDTTPPINASACASEGDACSASNRQPTGDMPYFDPSSFNPDGTITYGIETTAVIQNVIDCDQKLPANLRVTFDGGNCLAGNTSSLEPGTEMSALADHPTIYTAPVKVTSRQHYVCIEDLDRHTTIKKDMWPNPSVSQVTGASTPYDVCKDYPNPKVVGELQLSTSQVYAGDTVRVLIPARLVKQCNGISGADTGNNLVAKFRIENSDFKADFDGENYYKDHIFNTPGDHEIRLVVEDTTEGRNTINEDKSKSFYVNVKGSTAVPTVIINNNLEYSYHVGDVINNIGCSFDPPDLLASISWTVQTPDPDPTKNILTCEDNTLSCNADKSSITSFKVELQGKYIFKCIVTAGDGITKALDSRPVQVYPVDVPVPNLSILVSPNNAVSVGTPLNFKVGNPQAGFTYHWDFGNGQGLDGEDVNFTYNTPAQYEVYLTATTTVNGQTYSFPSQVFMIYVSSAGVPLPGMSIIAPSCGVINTSIPFKVGSPDTTNYNYAFNFTDGPPVPLPAGVDTLNHSFAGLGSYVVNLSATLKNPPNTLYQNTHNIAIANICQ